MYQLMTARARQSLQMRILPLEKTQVDRLLPKSRKKSRRKIIVQSNSRESPCVTHTVPQIMRGREIHAVIKLSDQFIHNMIQLSRGSSSLISTFYVIVGCVEWKCIENGPGVLSQFSCSYFLFEFNFLMLYLMTL